MVTDIRDVYFQDDPFAHNVGELEVFLEDDSIRLGSEPFNRRWLLNLYGPKTARGLESEVASCSGTTLGTGRGMLRYLRAMVNEIELHRRPLGSHDQGVHNFLLRTGRLEPVKIGENGYSPVLTMGMNWRLKLDSTGRVLNRDGRVPAVIHQYDRNVEFAQSVRKRFATSSPSASELCHSADEPGAI
jgi:hypothetical protein